VDKRCSGCRGGFGGSGRATGARPDFGVTPDQDLAILRIRVGWSLFYFDHSSADVSGLDLPTMAQDRRGRSSAQSGGMAVEVAGLGHILFLLWGHFGGILTARHTARAEFFAGDI